MDAPDSSPSTVRRGRFLWMADTARKEYLNGLKEKISGGHFFRETVLSQVVEDLAPFYAQSGGVDYQQD